MGLFSMFKNQETTEAMTPQLALAVSLLYISAADGEMDAEEVGGLLAILGGQSGRGGVVRYSRKIRPPEFLAQAAPMLTEAQKFAILVNMLDSALSDGQPEVEEQQLFGQFLTAFGVSEDRFKPFFDVIQLKYERRLFVDPNHPMNQPGFRIG
jgi:uncharacterized tellurite resistance protein B-like protein